MVFSKLLAFLHRKKKPHLIADMLPKPSLPDFIIIPPEQNAYQEQDIEVKEKEDELCEEPRASETFHAVNPQIAREKAAAKNLLILYAGRERWDLYHRTYVFWGVDFSLASRLLQLETDMKSQDEFTPEEQAILKDLALKRWIKTLKNGGVYYYGLSSRTAMILRKQMIRSFGKQSHIRV
jgi:hypothetical protein